METRNSCEFCHWQNFVFVDVGKKEWFSWFNQKAMAAAMFVLDGFPTLPPWKIKKKTFVKASEGSVVIGSPI